MTEDGPADAVEELLPAYALNALDGEDASTVEHALEREPRYREILERYLAAAAHLAGAHAAAVPSAAVRDRVMARVRAASPGGGAAAAAVRAAPRAFWGLAAALALALLGLGTYSVVQQQRLADLEDQLQATTADAEGKGNMLEGIGDLMARPGVVAAPLSPAPQAPGSDVVATLSPERGSDASGMVITGADGESVLLTMNLAPLGEAETYQAWWWDEDGDPSHAAVFDVDDDGFASVPLRGRASGMYSITVHVARAGETERPARRPVIGGTIPTRP